MRMWNDVPSPQTKRIPVTTSVATPEGKEPRNKAAKNLDGRVEEEEGGQQIKDLKETKTGGMKKNVRGNSPPNNVEKDLGGQGWSTQYTSAERRRAIIQKPRPLRATKRRRRTD